jgi:heme-degrading monooxygenase HmoA
VITRAAGHAVNLFKVPSGESERFLERWNDNARVMVGQSGFIRVRLLRSLVDIAEMRHINVAEWASGADLERGYANPSGRSPCNAYSKTWKST